MNPTVAVIVLARDHWSFTETTLRTLARTRDVNFETLVVDNGSAAEAQAALVATAASDLGARLRLRYELNAENVGVASGRNQGVRLTSAPLLLFLDNDVKIIDSTWLATLIDVLGENPLLGAVGGVLLTADDERSVQFSGGAVDARAHVHFDTETLPDPELQGHARATAFCLGACLLTPRALFEASGGFDPLFDPMDFEDIDYCLRLAEAGRPSAIALRARLAHYGHVTTGSQGFARMRHYLINGRSFVQRWGDRQPPSNVRAAALVRERS